MGLIIAPNGRWTANDKVGNAAVGALLYTYRNQTRNYKNTYADAGGTVLNQNPIVLDTSGSANIFWEDDEYYTIELWSVQPNNPTEPYELIYSEDNYPAVTGGSGGDVIINQTFPNLVRNPQFTRWGNDNYLSSNTTEETLTRLGTADQYDYINTVCDDWFLRRTSTDSTIIVSRKQFTLGQTEVPGNPVNYLNYQCTAIGGGGETALGKYLAQIYTGVQTLSNTQVSVGIWARSTSSSDLNVSLLQQFGTGGTPSSFVNNYPINVSLTPVWTQYSGTIVVSSVAGKTLGTDNNHELLFAFHLPINQVASIDICNVQLHTSPELPSFAYLPINDQLKRTDTISLFPVIPTGSVVFGIFNTAPTGWVLCNDGTIGSFFSGASYAYNQTLNLYILLWENVSNTYAPILTSGGVASTRGASAIADYNANKRLTLTKMLGRALSSGGSGSGLSARTLGEIDGQETVALTGGNNGPHNHGYTQLVNGSPHTIDSSGDAPWHFTSGITTSSGSGTPHENMQPTIFLNSMIKL